MTYALRGEGEKSEALLHLRIFLEKEQVSHESPCFCQKDLCQLQDRAPPR